MALQEEFPPIFNTLSEKQKKEPYMPMKRIFPAAVLCLAFGSASAAGFKLVSPTVKPNATLTNEQVFNGFGCAGKNVSPELKWSGEPKGTKSYALTVYDPDAPTGSGWWHWVVYDIPASAHEIPSGAGDAKGEKLPAGSQQGRTDFGTKGFGGACPPKGDKPHHYVFTLYALKVDKLEIPADATAALIGYMIHTNALARTGFTARYGR